MIKRAVITLLFTGVAFAVLVVKPMPQIEETVAVEHEPEDEESPETGISSYDSIMQTVEEESGIDWRLLSAIAYIESRFHDDVVSPDGAMGLMQIQPVTARHFGISADALLLPHNNIRVAAFHLREIEQIMKLPAGMSEHDRMSIVLACYNSGIGHVNDARRLAREFGEDMNSWQSVSRYLTLKSNPEYYELDVVRAGRFNSGLHTSTYVTKVMNRYEYYCKLTDTTAMR